MVTVFPVPGLMWFLVQEAMLALEKIYSRPKDNEGRGVILHIQDGLDGLELGRIRRDLGVIEGDR